MLNEIQAMWHRFEAFEFSYEVLMGVGALLLIVAILKIIRSSLTVFFWVVLGGIGAASFSYGMSGGDSNIANELGEKADLSDIMREGKEDVLRILCEKLPGYLPQTPNQ